MQNKTEIANVMNRQFCEMGANLAEKLSPTEAKFTDNLPTPSPNREKFILHPSTESEVDKETQELDENKSIGIDEISLKILKWSAVLLTETGVFATPFFATRLFFFNFITVLTADFITVVDSYTVHR